MKTITEPADIPDRHPVVVDEGPLADALAIEHAAAVAEAPDLEPQPEDSDFHTPAKPEDDGPETLAHLVGALAHLLDVPTEDIFDILETGPTSTERVRHNPGGGR